MKRFKFLLLTCAILTTTLYIFNQAATIHAQHEALSAAEADKRVEVLATARARDAELAAERAAREAAEAQAEEYREILVNRALTYDIVASSRTALSRSGREYTAVTMPADLTTGFSAQLYDHAFSQVAPGMVGMGEALIISAQKYGINELILAGIAHLESDGGNSYFATARNNLFGLGAYTNNPNNAYHFETKDDSLYFAAELLSTHYAPGGKYYGGSYDLEGFGVRYACDPHWAAKVASRMERIVLAAMEPITPIAEVEPVKPEPEPGIYTVVAGDTMTKIAQAHGMTVAELVELNPQIENPNLIHVGQEVNVSRAGGAI